MAYDEELAHRIRELLDGEQGVSEMAMFGGLAFLLHGNMAVAASGQGGLMVRADPEAGERLLARPHARAMEMRGREMNGWIARRRRGRREQAPARVLGAAGRRVRAHACRAKG